MPVALTSLVLAWSIIAAAALPAAAAGTSGATPAPTPVAGRTATPSAASPTTPAAWIRAHAIPIATDDPTHALSDLEPLRALVGNARVVALGEATHGTREFFRVKHRMIEYLATRLGFTRFAIEANLPEAERINRYLRTGEGDPAALLQGLGYWTWDTQEVLDLLRWMREFNRSGRGRIEFAGFDMQSPGLAMQEVRAFVAEADSGYAPALEAAYRRVANAYEGRGSFGSVLGTFPLERARGKRVRFYGSVRTEGVEGGFAGLWWRVDGGKRILEFDNMRDRAVRGTSPWKHCEITMEVPERATGISFGLLLSGSGAAWFDSLGVEVDGVPWLDRGRFDFSFEDRGGPIGFAPAGAGYETTIDTTSAREGRSSLRLRSTGDAGREVGLLLWPAAATLAAGVVSHLDSTRAALVTRTSAERVEWAIQYARVVSQMADLHANRRTRNRAMADNVAWLLDRAPPGSKLIVWSHNGHVGRGEGSMGGFLAERLGTSYLPIGFAFHEGRFNAYVHDGEIGAIEAPPAPPGSVEEAFHQAGVERFVLDLRAARGGSAIAAWLAGEHPLRANVVSSAFRPTRLSRQFDAVLWIEYTTPTTLLR